MSDGDSPRPPLLAVQRQSQENTVIPIIVLCSGILTCGMSQGCPRMSETSKSKDLTL